MKRWQKIVLAILSIFALAIVGISVYGVKFMNDASKVVGNITEDIDRKSSLRSKAVNIDDQEPFSVLLLGLDTGGLGRTEQGRSDTMMVVTVNPEQKKSTIVSLDRDIYTNIVGNGTVDKLNHAYAFGGVKMAMDSVEQMMDIPIDHYVTINLDGMKDLIDAVGGIEVDNKIDFTLDGIHVPKGKQKLDGTHGLAYARMRHEDPKGDVGRQERQREVVKKIVNKVLSLDGASNYKKILKAVEKNVRTDLEWDDMMDVATNYTPAFSTIEQDQVEGQGEMINNVYYQILGKNSLLKIQNNLKKQLELKTSKTLPNLKEENSSMIFYDDGEEGVDPGIHYDYGGGQQDNTYDNGYDYGQDQGQATNGYTQNDGSTYGGTDNGQTGGYDNGNNGY